jgi:uncharacterized SAM-binding protein YcdF (DUF218 family)
VYTLRITLIVAIAAALFFAANCGRFLVVNDLQKADNIVVLAGETHQRPARGMQLLAQNYAGKMLLNVPVGEVIYNRNQIDLAADYIQASPYGRSIQICPVYGLSTKTEAQDVGRCLQNSGVRRLLLVTSDYHSRRARSIFQHELKGYEVFVTPTSDPQQFGTAWWQHRQWAKTSFDEWLRLLWWELIDQWR